MCACMQVDGKAVPSWGALYVATMLDADGEALSQVFSPPQSEACVSPGSQCLRYALFGFLLLIGLFPGISAAALQTPASLPGLCCRLG